MSKVVVAGKAIVINSGVKLEDLKLIKKFRPDALILKGGEDGKEQIFRIDVAENEAGNINKYGAVFGEATRDEGFATLTMILEKRMRLPLSLITSVAPSEILINSRNHFLM